MDIKKKVLFFQGDMGGCALYRVQIPAVGLLKSGKYDVRSSMIINQEKFEWNPEVIVFSRQHKPEVVKAISAWRSAGKTTVYDCDDDLLNVPEYNPAHQAFKSIRKEVIDAMRACDILTVSTQPLKDLYAKYHPNVIVLPNQILPEYSQYAISNHDNWVRIGWSGTNTHSKDFAEAENALLSIADKYSHVKFIFFGYAPPMIAEKLKSTDSSQFEFVQGVSVEKYHQKLGSLGLDIGIAPLEDNQFNRGKSNLKVLEYGLLGCPAVVSPVYPYATTVNHRVDGMVVKKNRYKSWVDCLSRLIENPEMRRNLGSSIKNRILSEFSIHNNVGLWEEAYFGKSSCYK